jgi:hypothetical protein
MEAGRELDALVAAKVMGLIVRIDPMSKDLMTGKEPGIPPRWGNMTLVRPYSTSIEHAWQVLETLQGLGAYWTLGGPDCRGKTWVAQYGKGSREVFCGEADTAPLAICLAALKAVGGEA